MKKLWNRIKNIHLDLRVLLIVLVILINFLLLFKPEIFKNKTSYITVKAKNQQLKDINNNIMQSTNSNTDMTMQIADLREQDVELGKRAMINRKEVDPNGLEFHLPSILIRLEDSSKANGLSIAIKYSEIAYQDIQGKEIDMDKNDNDEEKTGEEDGKEDGPTNNKNKDISKNILLSQYGKDSLEIHENGYSDVADNKFNRLEDQLDELDEGLDDNKPNTESDEKEDTEPEEEPDIEKEMIEENKERFKEEGVEVTQIPIDVKGTYAGVKKFIKDLDKLNYLEPTKVEIKSLGQTVEAKITISIFHGDIFR